MITCRNCKYFLPDNYRWFSTGNALRYAHYTHGRARTVHPVSRETTYDPAWNMRKDASRCGTEAKLYVHENNPLFKFCKELSGERIVMAMCIFVLARIIFGI